MRRKYYLQKIRKAIETHHAIRRRLLSLPHEGTRHLEKAILPNKEFLTQRIALGSSETKALQKENRNTKKTHEMV